MIDDAEIRDIAAVFKQVGGSASEAELAKLTTDEHEGSRAEKIFQLIKDLDGKDIAVACRDIGFFRFFLVNTLIQAQRLNHELRMIALRAIGNGLHEFAAYFSYLDSKTTRTSYAELANDSKRFFAFCIAQLIELGFDMDGLLMTMKGDAHDQADAYELRRLREEGPDAFANTYLFDAEEKKLWDAVFDKGGQPAVSALQRHFVTKYELPFIATPEAPADA